ncbi:MAG: hypothetical protein V3S89_12410 [Desulfobacterales bacterium]
MIHRHRCYRQLAWAMGLLSIWILFGCAAQKPIWGDPDSGLILTYRAAEGGGRQYQNTITVIQDLEMMGQHMKTETKTDMGFTVASKGMDAESHVLDVAVDTLRVEISGPQGNRSPDTSGITGKHFDMTLSPLGKELDVSGAAALTYETSPLTKGSLEPIFATIFPDLPARPVKQGDTWTSTSDTARDDGNTKINTVVQFANVLGGPETVDGRECIKVTGEMTGTMTGKGNQMGSDFTLSGNLKGTTTWFFDYKEGALVKRELKFTGDLKVESAMGSMPVALENIEETRLVQ